MVGSPKGKRIRRVPLDSAALEALASSLRTGNLVFGQRLRGEMYTYRASLEAIKRYARAAGLKGVSWHTLRHTFASRLVMAGVDILAVQQYPGHVDIKETMKYAHLAPQHLNSASEWLVANSKKT